MTWLVDTGPLVSAFARRETKFKAWAESTLASLPLPILTCEAVITEAAHLLGSSDRLLEAMERKLIVCRFDLQRQAADVRWLMRKYADRPMDLADACLVQMYSSFRPGTAKVVTIDSRDFGVYRTREGKRVDCLFPEAK